MDRPGNPKYDDLDRGMNEAYTPLPAIEQIRAYLNDPSPYDSHRSEGISLELAGQHTRFLRADRLADRARHYPGARHESPDAIARRMGVSMLGLTENIRNTQTAIVSPIDEVLRGTAWEPYYDDRRAQFSDSALKRFGPLQVIVHPDQEDALASKVHNTATLIGPEASLLPHAHEFLSLDDDIPTFHHNKRFQELNSSRKRHIEGFWQRRPQLDAMVRTFRRQSPKPDGDLYDQGVLDVVAGLLRLDQPEIRIIATADELSWQPWVTGIRRMFETESWRTPGTTGAASATTTLTLCTPENGAIHTQFQRRAPDVSHSSAA